MDADEFEKLGGWIGIDERQQLAAAAFRPLSEAAPQLMQSAGSTEPIVLYKAWRDVLGKYPDYLAQVNGSCVSMGHGHGNDLLQCVEIALGEASDYRETHTEFIYAASREVAGILGRSDGSYGSAAVKAMTTIGVVSREMLGSDGAYSGPREKDWGYHGPPKKYKELAAPYKLGSAAKVTTWAELVAAVTNGYPVTICSNWGFNSPRDEQGFCAARGTWPHCMCIAGVRFDREGACVLQSWGPKRPQGPLGLDQPSFSFWAERGPIEKILAQDDSWALAKAADFVKRDLPASWRYVDMA